VNPFDQAPRPQLSVAARTDRGRRREANEDALFAADPCFVVADGMGGHERGDAASKAAISAFSEEFTAPGEATVERIERALAEARARVDQVAESASRGAGCTLTGAIRISHEGAPHWYVLNVGDSRVYLQRRNELRQLTVDHSLRSERIAVGNEQASATPRNIITRALGSDDDRHDAWLLPIETGSRLLVCSDGLSVELSDEQIEAVLAMGGRTESVVDELIRRSLDAGGRDNISVILVDVISGGIEMIPTAEALDDSDGTTIEITRPRSR
jgi:protein phosphatase